MDKTTKAFVIAACSVVISVPVIWLGGQISNGIQRAEQQRQLKELEAEVFRQKQRYRPCSERIDREGPRLLDETKGVRGDLEKRGWISACQKSTLPVEEFR